MTFSIPYSINRHLALSLQQALEGRPLMIHIIPDQASLLGWMFNDSMTMKLYQLAKCISGTPILRCPWELSQVWVGATQGLLELKRLHIRQILCCINEIISDTQIEQGSLDCCYYSILCSNVPATSGQSSKTTSGCFVCLLLSTAAIPVYRPYITTLNA